MNNQTVIVTGASGFIGRYVVQSLLSKGYCVIAGVHDGKIEFSNPRNLTIRKIDLLERESILAALDGADMLFHFAALVDSGASREKLYNINVEGSRLLWDCAAEKKIKKALYCSSTAVYGLMAKNGSPITEEILPRAVEPYGKSKFLGEQAVIEISRQKGLHTIIVRPVAVFGPGEHTPFGRKLREAAFTKLLIAGAFRNRKFNFIHVEDAAEAAVFLMERELPSGEIFNVTINEPILYEDAFNKYINVLTRLGRPFLKIKIFALMSFFLHKIPAVLKIISRISGDRILFTVWHPGFDLNYSSEKLMKTSFTFRYNDFGEVFYSCAEHK